MKKSIRLQESLDKKGFCIVKKIIPKEYLDIAHKNLMKKIKTSARSLSCHWRSYLKVVSRWANPSPITASIEKDLLHFLQAYVKENFVKAELVKSNVISKTIYAPHAVPFHQDITYNPQIPYDVSIWIPLSDVTHETGPLQFSCGSHKYPLQPAVDFWNINYKPGDPPSNTGIVRALMKKGDILIFDARVWHGSGTNFSTHNRFAFVTRWVIGLYPHNDIPPIYPAGFGMWTCQKETYRLLKKGLSLFFSESDSSYDDCLSRWIERLKTVNIPSIKDQESALLSLQRLQLLERAYHAHNGGDAYGIIYKNLWHKLLCDVQSYIDIYGK